MENIEKPEGEIENLSEYQKEILESDGIKSKAELDDILWGIKEGLKTEKEGTKEHKELLEQNQYFEELKKQLFE